MEATRVWYVAYGSNLARARFACYLRGGRPPGGRRDYPGCRDATPPTADVAVTVPGRLVFAGSSGVWGGGMAFYLADPAGEAGPAGRVAARAYLLSLGQFADVVAQEMWRDPGGPFAQQIAEITPAVETLHTHGDGRYETLHRLGERDGVPLLTVTSADPLALPPAAPRPAYLGWIAQGLRESHGWDTEQIAGYLGAAVGTTPDDIAALLAE